MWCIIIVVANDKARSCVCDDFAFNCIYTLNLHCRLGSAVYKPIQQVDPLIHTNRRLNTRWQIDILWELLCLGNQLESHIGRSAARFKQWSLPKHKGRHVQRAIDVFREVVSIHNQALWWDYRRSKGVMSYYCQINTTDSTNTIGDLLSHVGRDLHYSSCRGVQGYSALSLVPVVWRNTIHQYQRVEVSLEGRRRDSFWW